MGRAHIPMRRRISSNDAKKNDSSVILNIPITDIAVTSSTELFLRLMENMELRSDAGSPSENIATEQDA